MIPIMSRTCIIFVFIMTIPVLIFAKIVTLAKEKNITCVVTDLAVNSAIYLNPPIRSNFVKEPTEITTWIQDDWLRTHSMSSSYSPVTDKRWEDFDLSSENDGYSIGENPLSFSIYTTGPLTFTIYSCDFAKKSVLQFKPKEEHVRLIPPSCQWFHYTISTQNDTVNILKGDEVVETFKLTFSSPYWLHVDSPCSNETFWKVHNYEFRYSNAVTESNAEKSYLNISLSDNLCLSFYVSVERTSFLQITLESTNKEKTVTILGFNQENSLKKWKKIEITADSPGPANLSFYRGHMHNQKQGYWAVDDIKFCSKDLEIYQTTSPTTPTEDHTCETLDKPDMNIEMNSFIEPGSLGKVNCSTVLGTSYPYCENHRICLADSTCFCSWGYQGDFCDETCDVGTWGLFCTQQCPFSCKKCHLATGECLEERHYTNLSETELPKKIFLTSGQIHIEMPNYEDINGEVTYNFKYYCTSEWCQNQMLVKEDSYTIASSFDYKHTIVQNFDEMVPFTDYKPLVSMGRKDEIYFKSDSFRYPTISAQPELDNMELEVYSSNGTHLWIRFQPSQTSLENRLNYSLWYIQDSRLLNSTQIEPCKFWDGYLCGTISNLKSNTSYDIIVGERNFQFGTLKISSSVKGFTSERAPEIPTKFKVKEFSDKEIVLSWNQPDITNGPLKYFNLIVDANQEISEQYNILATDEITYKQKISVTTGNYYSFSVRASNTYGSEQTFMRFKIAPPTLKWHVPQPFAEVCYETCHLMIPKQTEYTYNSSYYILIIPNNDTIDPEMQLENILHSLGTNVPQDENLWTLKPLEEDNNFMRLELGAELENYVSLEEDDIYSMHLVLFLDNRYVLYDSISEKIIIASWSPFQLFPIILIFLLLPLLLFLGIKHKQQLSTQYNILPDVKSDTNKKWRINLKDYFMIIMFKGKSAIHPDKTNKVYVNVQSTA